VKRSDRGVFQSCVETRHVDRYSYKYILVHLQRPTDIFDNDGIVFLHQKKLRAYSEALLILAAAHLLYVFTLETKLLTEAIAEHGVGTTGMLGVAFYQFLWSFTDNMVIRFEPFLIGVYTFFKFRRKESNG
jgi:hypothetical protein